MTITKIGAKQAMANRRANAAAVWGERGLPNRVEPIASPEFRAPFLLEPGQCIFTMGSCFARNVEKELQDRGFEVPMLNLMAEPEFRDLELSVLNVYGVPSIYNELAWSFGEVDFDEKLHFAELGNGRWVDLNLVRAGRPAPLDLIRERRRKILANVRQLAEADVFVITLGLSEVWWDNLSTTYLNAMPLPSLISQQPDRFELHALDYAETLDYLTNALNIAFRHGRADLQILMSVSPVPLTLTFRNQDVMVANSYSKSVLRAAADKIAAEFERVHYFPSFESITLSARDVTWKNDFTHVTDQMIAHNVERMLAAFGISHQSAKGSRRGDVGNGHPELNLPIAELARRARVQGDRDFFEDNEKSVRQSGPALLEFAEFLYQQGRFAEALAIVESKIANAPARTMRAKLELALGRYEAAIETIDPLCHPEVRGHSQWPILMDAIAVGKDEDRLLDAERRWVQSIPTNPTQAYLHTAEILSDWGRMELARERLVKAWEIHEGANLHLTQRLILHLLEMGRTDEASDFLQRSRVAQRNPENPLYKKLMAAVRDHND